MESMLVPNFVPNNSLVINKLYNIPIREVEFVPKDFILMIYKYYTRNQLGEQIGRNNGPHNIY